MALIAHPDRGGSAEQMCALREEYCRLKAQLTATQCRKEVFEAKDLTALHASSRDCLDASLISLMDVYDETHANTFAAEWHKRSAVDEVERASEPWGYT